MHGAVPSARRSQAKLPDGSQQELVLLLWLWPRRRRDPFRRVVSSTPVSASRGALASMAWRGELAGASEKLLPHSVTPPFRSSPVFAPTRFAVSRSDRTHADRLRAGPLPARLADAVGLPTFPPAPNRPGQHQRLGCLFQPHCISAGRQPLWPQHWPCRPTPLPAGHQGGLVLMGASPAISGSDSRGWSVRRRRVVADRFSQRHLLAGNLPQCAPVSATVRRSPNRLSEL